MPAVMVKYKCKDNPSSGVSSHNESVTVTKKPPSESEVLAALKKKRPKGLDFVILEIK